MPPTPAPGPPFPLTCPPEKMNVSRQSPTKSRPAATPTPGVPAIWLPLIVTLSNVQEPTALIPPAMPLLVAPPATFVLLLTVVFVRLTLPFEPVPPEIPPAGPPCDELPLIVPPLMTSNPPQGEPGLSVRTPPVLLPERFPVTVRLLAVNCADPPEFRMPPG